MSCCDPATAACVGSQKDKEKASEDLVGGVLMSDSLL